MNKIGIIDMGTNTFHLLVASPESNGYEILHREHEAVKLGMAGINEGYISDNACHRAIQAMQKFKSKMNEYRVSTVYAFGTSALRNAVNGKALVEKIHLLTGIQINIISGEEEADLIYEGVKFSLDLGTEVNLVMDIGAGSVEFIIGDQFQIFWKQSFEIGGQRLLERFQKHDPIAAQEILSLNQYFGSILAPLLDALQKFKPTALIGSSGSFDTLSDIFSIRNSIPRASSEKETPLTHEGFFEIYQELIRKNREERMQIPGMIALRVDMIVVACCLIRFILETHKFKRIRVSTYSLKEGVLSKLSQGKLNI